MAVGFTVKIDDRDLREVARRMMLMQNKLPNVLVGAINKTLAKAKTVIVDGIRDATTLQRGRVLKGTKLIPATVGNASGRVIFQGRAIGAVNFKHKVSKAAGVTVQTMKNQPELRYRHGFKGIGLSGNKHLFYRDTKRPMGVVKRAHHQPNIGKTRQYLKTIYGPRLQSIMDRNPQIEANAHAVVSATIREQLYSQVDRFLVQSKSPMPNFLPRVTNRRLG